MVTIVPDAVIKQECLGSGFMCVCVSIRDTHRVAVYDAAFVCFGVKGLSARSQPGSRETHVKCTRSNVSSISSCTSDFLTFAFNYSFLC